MDPLTSTDILPQKRGSPLRLPHVVNRERGEGGVLGVCCFSQATSTEITNIVVNRLFSLT